ncbi:MAG TPA: DUF1579 family protein [Kofleriaceae bacterium]|nr:DUF1579 family protein [Kofleriaceae bacterium]
MRTLLTTALVVAGSISVASAAPDDKAKAPAPAKDAKAAAPAPAPPPPELKKTVDAFVGNWTIDGTATMPGGAAPMKLKETVVCTKAVAGRVASCTGRANIPGMGKVEDLMVVTYDAEAKKVRVMGISSMGDVHDHVCTWKDDKTLACDPLQVTAMGSPATVTFEMTWTDAKTATMNETVTMKDGSKMTMEGVGKKR